MSNKSQANFLVKLFLVPVVGFVGFVCFMGLWEAGYLNWDINSVEFTFTERQLDEAMVLVPIFVCVPAIIVMLNTRSKNVQFSLGTLGSIVGLVAICAIANVGASIDWDSFIESFVAVGGSIIAFLACLLFVRAWISACTDKPETMPRVLLATFIWFPPIFMYVCWRVMKDD